MKINMICHINKLKDKTISTNEEEKAFDKFNTIYDKSSPESSVQFSSVAQSCSTLFNLMDHSTPGLPVNYQLPEFTQSHLS